VSLSPPVGELIVPAPCNVADFDGQIKKLGGMQDAANCVISNTSTVIKQVLTYINVAPIENNLENGAFKFAGKTLKDSISILINIQVDSNGSANCKVFSENVLLRPKILNHLFSIVLNK
jgi:hypothetical protein